MQRWLVLAMLGACGDDLPCIPPDQSVTLSGPLSDPTTFPMPDGCVDRGMLDAVGRWLLVDATQRFDYFYPVISGSCPQGFHTGFADDGAHLVGDGWSLDHWTDATHLFYRTVQQLPDREITWADVYCMRDDGTLALTTTEDDSDYAGQLKITTYAGQHFARKDALASGLALVGELGLGASTVIEGFDLALDGDRVLVAGPLGLDVIDASDPAQPRALGHFSGAFNDVEVAHGDGRTIAYLSPYDDFYTTLVDITDPTAPQRIGSLPYSHTVTVTPDARLYLGDYTDRVPVYDITHPAAPLKLGAAQIPDTTAGIHDLAVDGTQILAADTTSGLVALDVSGGLDHAVELARLPTSYSHTVRVGIVGGHRVIVHGDEGWASPTDGAAFLRILDGDPASPGFMTELARYRTRTQVGVHNFELVGDRLYIAYYQDGVRVVDLSTPTAPREIAHYNTWDPATAPGSTFEGALGIRVANGLVYVADSLRGLVILRET